MILTKDTLRCLFRSNRWKSNTNVEDLHFNPNSIDITLSPHYYTYKKTYRKVIDPRESNIEDFMVLNQIDDYIDLLPKEFILGSANESFDCSEPVGGTAYVQMLDGRSTLSRLGISIHNSAGFGDYGFNDTFTLGILNNSPYSIRLYKNMRIAQVYFTDLDDSIVLERYQGYGNNKGYPGLPRLGKDRF